MSIKINIGVIKKVGQPNFGSRGASCNIDFELDGLFDSDGTIRFQEAARKAYAACRQAVESELGCAREETDLVPRSNPIGGLHASSPPQDGYGIGNGRTNSHTGPNTRMSTASQVRAIYAIANRSRVDLPGLLSSRFAVSRPEDLSIADASALIDELKGVKGSPGNCGGAMIGLVNHCCGKPPGIAGRDFISWSQLSTFRQCPLRYQFRYLDKVEPEFVASSLLVGSSIHSAIELFHRRQLEGGEPATLDELLTEFWDEWRCRAEESPEIRFSRNENFDSIQQLASRMLKTFIESEIANPTGVIIGIEESLRSAFQPDRPDFLGIVDLVFVNGTAVVIRDYKSSRSRWRPGTAESSADQLLMYSDLVRSLLPDREVQLEFAVITKTKSPTVELFRITADSKRIERTKQVAARTLDAIEMGVFYPNQSAINCGGCPYRSACARWRG